MPAADKKTEAKRVAIIGAGSAGLAAANEFCAVSSAHAEAGPRIQYAVTLYERRPRVGGIWLYDPHPGACRLVFDPHGTPAVTWAPAHAYGNDDEEVGGYELKHRSPGPMYEGLRTNIPSDLMAYRDAPFPEGTPLFPPRAVVQSYLEEFAQRVLGTSRVDVRLNTRVAQVYRLPAEDDAPSSPSRWVVESEAPAECHPSGEHPAPERRREEFDHIVLASGRCNTPSIPYIPGLWNWTGQVLHSAWYRTPYDYKGKNVLVLGNMSSGMDICRELVGNAARVLPAPTAAEPPYAGADGAAHMRAATEAWRNGAGTLAHGGSVTQSVIDIDAPPPLDYDPRDAASPAWSRLIRVVPRIARIDAARIYLVDGSVLDQIDVIIFATGFAYDFPFLDQSKPPFCSHPLVPMPPPRELLTAADAAALRARVHAPFRRQWPTAPALANLDDWQLCYRFDGSLAVLGAPVRIVPFPFAQVQARYLAQHWAGRAPPLTKLDPRFPPNDPARWVSPLPPGGAEAPPDTLMLHDMGTPSDTAYTNGLLRHFVPPEDVTLPEWDATFTQASDGKGGGAPRGPEGWRLLPTWRQQRRANGTLLRREELGF
ncbi:FAD/NAD(P)-binding domain-containing protein [Tilletiaria anomala UBC 951]|uniref:FAD/NAD(P)-binding domain-containing protein n=1 Tax=Tilletiaria anomala (strain ATCC 24038 / CBS 436.72 / UBC 951) TaxID=1037660 RepID=A0A066VG12_TILAU|nr:FAD/NAD(P)-binding domain-containing protein [Tilletiaria anomala UBC 951]KDN39238.1 FAD/NAD(P)-binding domain-containing protein [Tilletiaria anomala UBC 951]